MHFSALFQNARDPRGRRLTVRLAALPSTKRGIYQKGLVGLFAVLRPCIMNSKFYSHLRSAFAGPHRLWEVNFGATPEEPSLGNVATDFRDRKHSLGQLRRPQYSAKIVLLFRP